MASSPADRPHATASICLFCGSSNDTDPAYLAAATGFGQDLAARGVRLVYGGGGVGLMGAAARGAHHAGGQVFGVIPHFLRRAEIVYDEVETVVVDTMHQRKQIMFEQSDAFAVFPGGIGTLEEVIELMSWRRLGLHAKPILFLDLNGFWGPLFALFDHMAAEKLSPPWLATDMLRVTRMEDVAPTLLEAIAKTPPSAASPFSRTL